jgi:Zn-dependent M16 (insulinase) family peptidase
MRILRIAAALTVSSLTATAGSAQSIETLRKDQILHGFRAQAVYLDGSDRPMGARLVHQRTGFTLDLLRHETAPQGFTWVNTFLVSDMGEPHTQEHLLLGKGNVGRAVANLESYSLVSSSAFVTQWRTQYHFNAPAGPEVFFRVLEAQLDAILNPDYTDEEIRREVRNIGVAQDADGTLRLEEKGTVYNEMVSSFERPGSRLFRVAGHALYGDDHPLAMSAGGWPGAIRVMTPEHIRAFHRATHHLGNMGIVASLPRALALDSVLARMDGILGRLHRDTPEARGPFPSASDLPTPRSASADDIRYAEYPHRNPDQPSPLMFAWRPERALSVADEALLGLFLSNFAGDPTTNLYRIFVESQTREIDIGAKAVSAWAGEDQGHPVYVYLSDVIPSQATPELLVQTRDRILEELRTIATWADGSPELAAFNDRLRSRVVELRREMANWASAPPGFGQRFASSRWATHLHRLASTPDFRKSVTVDSELQEIERLLAGSTNIWRARLTDWALLGGAPYIVMSQPSPALVEREERERRERLQAELDAMRTRFGVTDPQEAIRRYAAEYEEETARLEALAAASEGRFMDDPPLSLDEPLDFREVRLGPNVPVVWSRFEGVPAVTAGLALRLDAVPDEELMYLSLLPALLTQVGVIRDGIPIPHGEMRNRLRQEILSLNSYYSTNPTTGRVELVVRGAGNDVAEAEQAVRWMSDVLYAPDWRVENLPRIRDVVDQGLAGLRNTTTRSEETWVNDPANAYRYQRDRLYLSTASFQTRVHAAHRLRWQLKEAPEGDAAVIDRTLSELARRAAGIERARLGDVLRAAAADSTALSSGGVTILREALRDMEMALADVPDGSLAADFGYLAEQIRRDLRTPPATALAAMTRMRQRALSAAGARSFLIASPEHGEGLRPSLDSLFSGLRPGPAPGARRAGGAVVLDRLRGRSQGPADVVFVGLVNPNTQGGVFLNTAPMASYRDRDRAALIDFLAAQQYSGGGAHSMFMKTWAAGLAYSNGLRSSPATGFLTYYAERVPELPQTMRFVIDELRNAPSDLPLTEYAIAMAFRGIRSAHSYEARGEAMANDLADGLSPDVVRGFLATILALRQEAGLGEQLRARMESIYGRVLPGYGPASSTVVDGSFFVIGPEMQLRLYEEYLRSAEGAGAQLHRLYPRDFWILDE